MSEALQPLFARLQDRRLERCRRRAELATRHLLRVLEGRTVSSVLPRALARTAAALDELGMIEAAAERRRTLSP